MDLILASTSPYRRAQIERLGIPFRCVAPEIDEDALKRVIGEISPRDLAERLARAKAASIARREPDAVVIGGDQVVAFEGEILGKPGTSEQAIAQLSRLAGRSHDLVTALVVANGEKVHAQTDVTTLTLRPLTLGEIHRYVKADQPLDCAGSYKLEARGIALFERIVSDDPSAIVGVPLMALTTILRGFGFAIP